MTAMACEAPPKGAAEVLANRFGALVPVLVTDRLILRAPRVTDFPVYAEIACTERGKGISGPMSRADAWWDFVQLASGWMLHGHGGWAIEDRADHTVYGFVILGLEPGDLETELGYLLAARAEGRGVAFEAAIAARDWAGTDLNRRTLVSYIAPDNARSIRLATRLGAVPDGSVSGDDGAALIYRHSLQVRH